MVGKQRNQQAFERTLRTLRSVGRIEPQDAALVACGRTLAALMDEPGRDAINTAWAYLKVLGALRGEVPTDTHDDDLSAFLAVLQGQVGDAPES